MNKLLVLILFMISPVYAGDSLSALMQRMQSEVAVKINYQEIRTLELFDQDWQGSGHMYSTPDGIMLREQIQPKRLLMAVNKEELFYYDVENQVRHQGKMQQDDPLTLQFAVFYALINADEALLSRLYQIHFVTNSLRWLMTLTPKQAESGLSIVVSGPLSQKMDTIIIKQADGDLSEFMLQSSENSTGEQVTKTVNRLYAELVGK